MRPSKRDLILDAALRVVARDGVTAVTYESVAEEAGLTKGGLVYHFPSRETLLTALQEHLADQWEANLTNAAGKPVDQLTDRERDVAYARVAATSADHAELLLILEASTTPELAAPWTRLMNIWTPPTPTKAPLTDDEATRIIARLAADGLWLYDTITGIPMSSEVRAELGERIANLVNPNHSGA
ncbi:TetR/AcrR family transcriptional regulator [Leucobacter triazinivorans]|uniref:TetR family transcriptional regulator n=1 Tax=Leucobacter triazinivorans TaxID=1784719 RepID=A0A4P6KDJ4_9MICO|nr:TetR family transcriptional regulator [Leucobacter triazinivorans]QBE48465.1 TetR family transcriptional regulator [Leucobacter triazinivorans]